jgi:hypothetical protein
MSRPDPRAVPSSTPRAGTLAAKGRHVGAQPKIAEVLPGRHNHRISAVVVLVVAGMVPWTGYLAYALPARYDAQHWNVLWAGFDLALMAVLAYTAWAAWFRRQIMVATALVAGTLLVCDAWFDVVTSFGTSDMPISLVTALGGELPLAVFFFWLARRIMMRTVEAFHRATDAPGAPPRLRDAPVLFATMRPPDVAPDADVPPS